ncbi:MAG: hypothetical protein KDB23_23280, partial [Planctomycetales bacterium]|nr:hypothetical protein [Planctomycetales bacterium]
ATILSTYFSGQDCSTTYEVAIEQQASDHLTSATPDSGCSFPARVNVILRLWNSRQFRAGNVANKRGMISLEDEVVRHETRDA